MNSAATRLGVIAAVLVLGLAGWAVAGYPGVVIGSLLGVALLVIPWHGQAAWSWAEIYLRRNRPMEIADPVTVANDRSGGGVRYQDDVAIVAVQVLGRTHSPTMLVGSTTAQTANLLDVSSLLPAMRQTMGLTVESLSVVTAGSRRRETGDYPRVYDTLIGTSPYAGQRETWLVIRIASLPNGQALRFRHTAGTAAVAAGQRIAASLRGRGIRARVASASDIVELEKRLGRSALEPHNRRWHSVRGDGGWLTTYAYLPTDIRGDALAGAWTLHADGIIQNVTLFPDGQACATVTVRTAQPPVSPPSVVLATLPGEQADALTATLCLPRPELRGLRRGALPQSLPIPVGPSGILVGKVGTGDRLLIPLTDPGEFSRVHIAAEDAIAKRLVIRAAGSGERLTIHTRDPRRWDSVRMPHVAVVDQPRPVPGTTVSVVDGTVTPAPRPNAVISVGPPGSAPGAVADVVIVQTGPASVAVTAGDVTHHAEVDLFRAENRYLAVDPALSLGSAYEMAD